MANLSKMKYKVVLVPFPFDDLSSSKVRPAVCLTDPIGPHRTSFSLLLPAAFQPIFWLLIWSLIKVTPILLSPAYGFHQPCSYTA
jgi:hypothetical protein